MKEKQRNKKHGTKVISKSKNRGPSKQPPSPAPGSAPFNLGDMTNIKNLDDLMAKSEKYANLFMHNAGFLIPVLFGIGLDGPFLLVSTSLDGEGQKDTFTGTAKLMCIAHAATTCVMTAAIWMDQNGDETVRPSESPSRREYVMLSGESQREGLKLHFLPIIRSDDGKFAGFGKCESIPIDTMTGRFAHLLPATPPDEAARQAAKAILNKKGVDITERG